jgi:hypothetical protein
VADGFNIEVTGDEVLRAKLEKLGTLLSDFRLFAPLLVPVFIGWMGAQFSSEGGWGGQTWAPLSPGYAVEKARTHPGRTILIRDGGLRRAASSPRREVTPRTLTLWIDDAVAPFHQEGTDKLPARPLIPDPLPASALRDIDLAAEVHVSTLIRSVGL